MAKGNKTIPYGDMRKAIIVANTLILEGKLQIGKKGNIEATKAFYDTLSESKNPDAQKFIEVLQKGRELFKDGKNVDIDVPAITPAKDSKTISYDDMGKAVIVVNTLILENKLQVGKNGNMEANKAFYDTLSESKNPDAKKFIEVLQKGRELFADAVKGKTEPAKAEKPAAEKAPKKKEGPMYDFEVCTAVLHKAQDLVREGKDLSSLTPEEQKIVHIAPAERKKRIKDAEGKTTFELIDGKPVMEPNPLAGRVGFTQSVLNSINGVISKYPTEMDPNKITVAEAEKMSKILTQAQEALAAAKASMGIEATEPAKEVTQEVAPDHS